MAAQFIYETKGYRSGAWSAAATNLYSSNGSVWNPLSTTKGSAFYRTSSSTWRRFYSGMDTGYTYYAFDYTSPDRRGYTTFRFESNGVLTIETNYATDTTRKWDISGAPDNSELEIFATDDGGFGTFGSSTFNTWLSLSSARSFTYRTDIDAAGQGTSQISIRHAPSLITLDSFLVETLITFNGTSP